MITGTRESDLHEVALDCCSSPSTRSAALLPVHVALGVCLEALRAERVDRRTVAAVRPTDPEPDEDSLTVRAWLVGGLASGLDARGCRALVEREAWDRAWTVDRRRANSLVREMVVVAATAIHASRASACEGGRRAG